MASRRSTSPGLFREHWEKLTAFACGLFFIGLMLTIAILIPNPTPTQWLVFRVVLALASAGVGAVIPGLIVVEVSTVVRAGGAIALFVLVYLLNPPQLVTSVPMGGQIHQTTGGVNSPAVVSSGDVVIGGETPNQKGTVSK
jgi:hypothetical protein